MCCITKNYNINSCLLSHKYISLNQTYASLISGLKAKNMALVLD